MKRARDSDGKRDFADRARLASLDLWTWILQSDILYTTFTMEREVDGWIQQLIQCKQLSEADVKKLCDKVRRSFLYCR